jgi:putative endonuclease
MARNPLKPSHAHNPRNSGVKWEKNAESFLTRQGLKLLERNFSSRFGEIDLVMEDDQTIVFVEVRYRHSAQYGDGAESVTTWKQKKISCTAGWFLARNPHRAAQQCRFDVISMHPQDKDQGINWIKNAFYSTIG